MNIVKKWRKVGLIFCPRGETSWMQSHAAVPIAEHLENDLFRIYFSSRDQYNRSFTGQLIIDLEKPGCLVDLVTEPILKPGGLGDFDDSGAMATWLTSYNHKKFLYYIGWNLGVTVPFRNAIGLAICGDEDVFNRYSPGPIVDRSMIDPYFCASCCVIPGEERWRIWYLSCTGWRMSKGKPEHRYHIKYAESSDGIVWQREGEVAIDYKDRREYAISRPTVIRENDSWKMWFSYRGQSYRIGYASSCDGRRWERKDHQAGIDVSLTGWDSEMIEYPFVFDHKGCRYMLYNGNGYGKTGFGLAVLE